MVQMVYIFGAHVENYKLAKSPEQKPCKIHILWVCHSKSDIMKLRLIYILSSILLFCLSYLAKAQLSFEDRSTDFFQEEINGILPLCVADFNGDFLDDVLTVPDKEHIRISFQLPNGDFYHQYIAGIEDIGAGGVWSLAAGDINGDGFNEALVGFGQSVFVLQNDLVENEMTLNQLDGDIFSQNISLGDINQDGVLDAFVCDDIDFNVIYYGDQNSNSLSQGYIFDNPLFAEGGNYGSAFTDVDGDCDLDLYIAKCKQGDNDPASPNRINLLYINENGQWIEEADLRNVATGAQSWTGTFGDLDNDLDLDLLITNHTDSNMVLLNDGSGNYQQVSPEGFRTTSFPLQSILRDLDNNGYLDIIITGSRQAIFLNQGNMTFEELPKDDFCCGKDMLSCAVGDLNNDGFLDIYGNFGNVYVEPSNLPDRVFYNQGNNNNFIAFNLVGKKLKNAIGAKVYCYANNGTVQMREVNMGDSYGIGNSLNVHFGIAQADFVDSIKVQWPNCSEETYRNFDINQYHVIGQEDCYYTSRIDLGTSFIELCQGGSEILEAPQGLYSYEWNTGEQSRSIVVSKPGHYQLTITDDTGCKWISNTVIVTEDPNVVTELVELDSVGIYPCIGDTVTLCVLEDRFDINWSTGATDQCIQVTNSGVYYADISTKCAALVSDSIELNFLEYPQPTPDEILYDEQSLEATFRVFGNDVRWYSDPIGQNFIGSGSELLLQNVDRDTSVYCQDFGLVSADTLTGGKLEYGIGGENRPGFPGLLRFDVFKPFILKSVEVQCFEANTSDFYIAARDRQFLIFDEVELEEGINTIELNIEFDPGIDFDIVFQGNPNCFRSTADVNYPYPIGDQHGSIKSGGFTQDEYFYFYNWKLLPYEKDCQSDLLEQRLTISSSIENIIIEEIETYPNPVTDQLNFKSQVFAIKKAVIRNVWGQIMKTKHWAGGIVQSSISFHSLPSGIYTLELYSQEQGLIKSQKIIKN